MKTGKNVYVVTRYDNLNGYNDDTLIGVYSSKIMAVCAMNKDAANIVGLDSENFDGVTWDDEGDSPAKNYYGTTLCDNATWSIEKTKLNATTF